jgi:hypothetical protein
MNAGDSALLDEMISSRWERAEAKRIQRTDAEEKALFRALARQMVWFILSPLGSRRGRCGRGGAPPCP